MRALDLGLSLSLAVAVETGPNYPQSSVFFPLQCLAPGEYSFVEAN